MSKSVVTISRKHGSHNVVSFVNDEEIGCAMKLDNFIEKLAAAMGSPIGILTKAQLLEKMKDAQIEVEEIMKMETTHIA